MSEIKRKPDGKYYVEFDEIPTLLFISADGHGQYDSLFINGEFQKHIRGIEIRSNVESFTEYTLHALAVKL